MSEGGGPLKLAVCLPAAGYVPAEFMYDYGNLMAFSAGYMIAHDLGDIVSNMVVGTYIHSARQDLALRSVVQETTHLLWLDTDMRFPRESLLRLLEHNKPMVGINYSTRKMPLDYVAIKEVGVGKGGRLVTNADSTGLEEVGAVGFGMVLMQTRVLECLPYKEPWFWYKWLKGRYQMGEDVYFCELIRKGGHKIYVDHDLSKECAHVGTFEYTLDHVEATKEEEANAGLD